MEYVSFRLDKPVLRQIERGIREFHYNTKSDFLRDAIRAKLQQLEEARARKEAWAALYAVRGALKGKGRGTTDEDFRRIREEAGEEFMRILEKRFAKNKSPLAP